MEIRAFAETVLLGSTMKEKLLRPVAFEDLDPGESLDRPRSPGRPVGLGLGDHNKPRAVFPGDGKLKDDAARGIVLHHFANHELLALELMALALLRFPDAPTGFRLGLVDTMLDEQRHLSLYRERMQTLGVGLGEIPVSSFFWNVLADMQTPMEFVTAMSLTLEQANLDFSLHFLDVFQALEDQETTAVMHTVYEDEVRHVNLGLNLFEDWRPHRAGLFAEYVASLPPRLTPRHAKGRGFSRTAREKAGLPPDYIDTLEVFSRSRGRPPRVFVFNAACEEEILDGAPPTLGASAGELAQDLESIPALVAISDDTLLLQRPPSTPFLRRLQDAGFDLPEMMVIDSKIGLQDHELGGRILLDLVPWGWSPVVDTFLEPLRGGLVEEVPRHPGWHPELRKIHGKCHAAEILASFLDGSGAEFVAENRVDGPDLVGVTCATRQHVEQEVSELRDRGHGTAVVKADLGASGRNMTRIVNGGWESQQLNWLEGTLRRQGQVVVEPWLDRIVDFSFHLDILEPGTGRFRGMVRFHVDSGGRFRSAAVGPLTRALPSDVARFVLADGARPHPLERIRSALVQHVIDALAPFEYRGPVGIDAFVHRRPEGQLCIRPLVEINPRLTMGRVALSLEKHVVHGIPAAWVFITQNDAAHMGLESLGAFADEVEAHHAPTMDGGRIRDGAVFTTDPRAARHVCTVLLVGRALEIMEQLPGAGPGFPVTPSTG